VDRRRAGRVFDCGGARRGETQRRVREDGFELELTAVERDWTAVRVHSGYANENRTAHLVVNSRFSQFVRCASCVLQFFSSPASCYATPRPSVVLPARGRRRVHWNSRRATADTAVHLESSRDSGRDGILEPTDGDEFPR